MRHMGKRGVCRRIDQSDPSQSAPSTSWLSVQARGRFPPVSAGMISEASHRYAPPKSAWSVASWLGGAVGRRLSSAKSLSTSERSLGSCASTAGMCERRECVSTSSTGSHEAYLVSTPSASFRGSFFRASSIAAEASPDPDADPNARSHSPTTSAP